VIRRLHGRVLRHLLEAALRRNIDERRRIIAALASVAGE
jgi:hypothetical protein